MKSDKYVNEKLNITALTPILIGDEEGKNLSPTTDFVVKGGKALIINQNKLESLLSEDMEILDEYVDSIKDGSFDLENFIKDKLNADIEELTSFKLSIEGYLGKNEVKSFITSTGKPFLPGSTIKGAIRTAVIYDYLKCSGKRIIKSIFNTVGEINKLLEDKKKRRLTDNEFKKLNFLKNVKLKKKDYNELILFKHKETKTDKNGNEYSIDWGHDFRHIQISDSQLLEPDNTKIIQLFRYYLTKDDTKTEPWAQVLEEKTTTEFNFKIEKNFKDPFLQTINSNTYKEIFKMVNKFSLDVLDFELEMFNEFIAGGKEDKQKIKKNLEVIISYYNDLKEKIKFSRDNCAVIRIGGGKTYFDNSIGLALFKEDKEKFKQFRKILGFWKHSGGWKAPFVEENSPITRTFYLNKSNNELLPVGWAVIYFREDKDDIAKIFNLEKNRINIKSKIENNEAYESDDNELDLSKLENLGRVIRGKNNK